MENRHGLVVEAELTRAAGFAERWGGDRADRRTHRTPIAPMATRNAAQCIQLVEICLGVLNALLQNLPYTTNGRREGVFRRLERRWPE
jgi:hypothetical protein